MTEASWPVDRPLDPYEARALALRTMVLARLRQEGAPDDPLLLRIISALARVPTAEGGRVAVVVAELMGGEPGSSEARQKTSVSVAGVAQVFDPEIQPFQDVFLEAAQYGAARDSHAVWHAYLQGLMALFEQGGKGAPGP